MRLAARHGIRTTLAWLMFSAKLIAVTLLPIALWSVALSFALDLIACALLVQGVYFGTRQVYQQLEAE